jgi:hypothetical protein
MRECTFSVDPQQCSSLGLFPTLEGAALNEPQRSVLVPCTACDIEIYKWVRRRKPSRDVLPEFDS